MEFLFLTARAEAAVEYVGPLRPRRRAVMLTGDLNSPSWTGSSIPHPRRAGVPFTCGTGPETFRYFRKGHAPGRGDHSVDEVLPCYAKPSPFRPMRSCSGSATSTASHRVQQPSEDVNPPDPASRFNEVTMPSSRSSAPSTTPGRDSTRRCRGQVRGRTRRPLRGGLPLERLNNRSATPPFARCTRDIAVARRHPPAHPT